jgi:hypothetical protein
MMHFLGAQYKSVLLNPRKSLRPCLQTQGDHAAQLETKVAITMLVGRFQVTRDPERMAYASVQQYIDELTAFLTMYQAAGLHLHFLPRA